MLQGVLASTLISILCPVDFSDQSHKALRWAVALAARYGSRLVIVHRRRANPGADMEEHGSR
jgi:nucleotide-binding universal stress UspA family protein